MKVTLKELSEIDKDEYPFVVSGMEEYFGREVIIIAVDLDGENSFTIEGGEEYLFSENWIN